jgi:hypothetical protein
LTTTDTLSWKEKSWIVGIAVDKKTSKAFDWNRLKRERIIHEKVGEIPVLLVLAADDKSFFAFQRPNAETFYSLKNDTLSNNAKTWNLQGVPTNPLDISLQKINAFQEFWHSWQTFHPQTSRY